MLLKGSPRSEAENLGKILRKDVKKYGFVCATSGERYTDLATRSARSLQKNCPDAEINLFTRILMFQMITQLMKFIGLRDLGIDLNLKRDKGRVLFARIIWMSIRM